MKPTTATIALAFTLAASTALGAPTPEQKCRSGKGTAAGKYAACTQTAYAKLATSGDAQKLADALQKCREKLDTAWAKQEANAAKANASCPDLDDAGDGYRSVLSADAANVARALGGAELVESSIVMTATGPVVDFGDVPVGTTSVQKFIPIALADGTDFSGFTRSPFYLDFDLALFGKCDIGPGTCTVAFTFTPQSTGALSFTLTSFLCPTTGGGCTSTMVTVRGKGV